MSCHCLKRLLGIQSDNTTKEEILEHYVYIAKLLLEVPERLELLKLASEAQLGLLMMTEKPGLIFQHDCLEMQGKTKQIGNLVEQWKVNKKNDKLLENLESNLDEDFENLERQYHADIVGEYEMWDKVFSKEAIKENILLDQERDIEMSEGWGIEDDPDTIAMEEEDEGPSHGNRNLERIEYHRYRPFKQQVIVTFKCHWTGEINSSIETLETVLQAPRAIRGYVRFMSKRARNSLPKRHPELEMYRPKSDLVERNQ